ncbi:GGDEF domain-containing protein [Streptomyces sp. NPDC085900]|uniref:GGDEF domain-containing protein n=1 Tax=Streptomyces sp. NPDC085900 TaxID=3365737 RepID=UPI0037D484D3
MTSPARLPLPADTLTAAVAVAAVPLTLAAVLADDIRVRRQLRTARRDPLTGLTSRDVLAARITRLARTHRAQLHVLVADADGLKTLNDTLGHAAGDALIATVGRRLGAWATARGGLAARLGGDEFAAVVLLSPSGTVREIRGLREQLAQPAVCGTHTLRPAMSIGTARAVDLPDAADADRLLRGADMAMYRVKTGQEPCGYVATRHDAYVPAVHGRRPGRPGTHLPPQ